MTAKVSDLAAPAIKPLVWRDHRPDSFPEPAWSAQTSFGFYNIEEVSASDSPAYVVRLHAHHFVADKDSLDEAKAAAQADYEARIKSALITAPPADAGMREAFVRVLASLAAAISILERTPKAKRAVASDKMFDQMLDDYRKALEAGRSALTAPDATTKSDGGVESRRHAATGNMSGAAPEAEQSSSATSFVRASGPEDKTLKPRAGVASGPSDLYLRRDAVRQIMIEQARPRIWVIAYPAGKRVEGLFESVRSGAIGSRWPGGSADLFDVANAALIGSDCFPQPLLRGMDDRLDAEHIITARDLALVAERAQRVKS